MLDIEEIKPEVRNMFKKRFPEVILRLPFIDKSHLKVEITKQGEKNVHYSKKDKEFSIYQSSGALKEATQWKQSFYKKDMKGVYVYGLGLGYYYFALKEWLQEHPSHYLIFMEDDIAMFYHFLQMPWAEEMLKNTQIDFIFFEDLDTFSEKISMMVWKYLGGAIEVTGLQSYLRYKPETFFSIHDPIIRETITVTSLVDEVVKVQGVPFYINFFKNLLSVSDTHFGKDLFGKFKGKPAILCGAGPSLNKNIELLKELGSKALIFAGGSGLNVLSRFNILPHLGGGIDPTVHEYDRFLKHTGYEVPIIVGSRLCFLAMDLIHGFRMFFVGNEGGYSIQRWFEDYYQLQEELKWSGFSIMTFITQIVQKMGCDPIIYIGTDLASSEMKKYAQGVTKENNLDIKEFNFDSNTWLGSIQTKDIYGKLVYTQWKWQMESKWISDFSKKHPDITFINATEGGIGFKDVPNCSLKEVIEKYCDKEFDFRNHIYIACREAKEIDIPKTRIYSFISSLKESLNRSKNILEAIIKGEKIHFFHEVGDKYLKKFTEKHEVMLEEISSSSPEDSDFLVKIENLKKIKNTLEKTIELSNNSLSTMYQLEEDIKEEVCSVKDYWEQIRSELAYRYYLNDLDHVLLARGIAMRTHYQSLENLTDLEKLEKQNSLCELELERIEYLKKGIDSLLIVIEKVKNSPEKLWSDTIECENGAYL